MQKAWLELRKIHSEYLDECGVKIPNCNNFSDTNQSIWLACLFLNRDRLVHKSEISEVTQHFSPNAGPDQQVRHLKRQGWKIGDKAGWHQLDPYDISSEFVNESERKRAVLSSSDFNDLKRAYEFRCATLCYLWSRRR